MKKFTLLAASVTFATIAMCAQNFAVVDMEKVLAKHPNTPNDKQQLEMTMADYSKERDTLKSDILAKEDTLKKKVQEAQNPLLAPAKAEEMKQACMNLQRDLESSYRAAEAQMQQRGRDLSDLEQRLIKRTTEEIQTHIAAYAKQKGYDIVFYKNLTPYVNSTCDITDQIILLCGGTPDKVAKSASELKAPAKVQAPATTPKATPAKTTPVLKK